MISQLIYYTIQKDTLLLICLIFKGKELEAEAEAPEK